MKSRSADWVVAGAFWTLSALCLLNLNDIVRMWIGVERAFSLPILLCCVVALLGVLRIPLAAALGGFGMMLLAALLSYLGIGILVTAATGADPEVNATWYMGRYLSSIVVIVAAAVGARVVLERAGFETTLLFVLGLLVASCGLMLASPWLLSVYQNPPDDGAFRYFGGFSNPNEAGLVACLTVVAALSLIRAGRFNVAAYGGLLVAVAALVGTYSRTSLIILFVLVAGALLVSRGAERWRILGGLAVVVWFGARTLRDLYAGVLLSQQAARLDSVVLMLERFSIDDVTLAGRLSLWQIAFEQALDSPLVGYGLGRFHSLDDAWYDDDGVRLGAHNVYLMFWGEAGFVPLALFMSFLAALLWFGIRRRGDVALHSAVGGWAVVFLLSGFTSHGLMLNRAANVIAGFSLAAVAFMRTARLAGVDGRPGLATSRHSASRRIPATSRDSAAARKHTA